MTSRFFSKMTLTKSLQFKHVVVTYVIAALVVNPAMAQQQTASLMKQQQMRAVIEKLSVDRQAAISAAIQLQATGNSSDPALKQALNGTTVVDIAAPSAKGVSKNNWNEFNVSEEGIIFNNSAAPVLTQLGGWSDGNRRLAGGEANIILNQVNGGNRSALLGQIEIAGKSAEFILANPNGITCDGCGFINTPNVSLITGQSRFESNGDLIFDIANGDVLIDGAGLNATNLDRFDIVSRYAKINANLYANNLNIVNGVNSFNYNTKNITTNTSTTNGAIQYAFDTTALGGMYANTIRLIGTEKGLGVNLQGLVQSTQDLEISADGNLQLKQIQANSSISLKSTSGNVSTETLTYAPTISIKAAQAINNNGFFAAKDHINLEASQINQNGNLYAGLDETNDFNSTGSLTIDAGQSITNTGDFYIGGQLNLTAPELNNQGTWSMQSADTLQADSIINSNSIRLNTQNATLAANTLINSGEILHLGNGLLKGNLIGDLDNTGVFGTNGNLQLTAKSLNNHGQVFGNSTQLTLNNLNNNDGELETGALTLDTQSFSNVNGRILALGNTNTSTFVVDNTIDNTNGVVYIDAGDFSLTANNLTNRSANFIVNNSQSAKIDLADQLDNQNGFFQANQLQISGLYLHNLDGQFLTTSLDGDLSQIDNTSGFIQANQLNLKGNTLTNSGGVILSNGTVPSTLQLDFDTQILNQSDAVIRNLNGDIQLTTTNFSNSNGLIDASQNGGITLISPELDNQSGSLLAKNNLQFSGNSVNNTEGYIEAGLVNFTLAGDLNNTQGVIQGGINIQAKNMINDQAYLLIDKDSTLQLTEDLQNYQGVISTQDLKIAQFTLNARNIINSGELVFDADNIDISASGTTNNTGIIQNTNLLNINATDLFNSGSIDSTQLTLNINNRFSNTSVLTNNQITQGQISADSITINTNYVLNDIYSLIYASQLNVDSALVENRGAIVADHATMTGNEFTQTDTAQILSATQDSDSLVLNFLTRITNAGQISRNSDWSITTGNFINNGRIESLGSGEIRAQQVINSDVQKIVTQADPSNININLDSGLISAGGISITTNNLDNRYGLLIGNSPPPNLPLTKGEGLIVRSFDSSVIQFNNQNGFIQTDTQDWNFNNIQLNNQNGTLWHSGSGLFSLNLIGNLDNSRGSIISQGNLSLTLLPLQNSGTSLTNNAGLIAANDVAISASEKIDNLNTGTLSGANLDLTAKTINNNAGVIEATAQDQALLKLAATQINNINGGEIRSAAKDWSMLLDSINNDGGNIIHTGSGTLTIRSNSELVNNGVIDSANHLVINANSLNNAGQLSAKNQLSLFTTNGLINQVSGKIGSSAGANDPDNFVTQLNATNQQITNNGTWYFGNNLTSDSTTTGSDVINAGEWVMGSGQANDIALTVKSFTNSAGTVSYNNSGNFVINAEKILNDASILALTGGVNVNLTNSSSNAASSFTNNATILAQRIQLSDLSSSVNSFTNNSVLQANQFTLNSVNLLNTAQATLYGFNNNNQAAFTIQNSVITNNGNWVNEAKDWTLSSNVNGSGTFFHNGTGTFSLALNNQSDLTGAYFETQGSAILRDGITGGDATLFDQNNQSFTRTTTLVSAGDMTLTGAINFINNGAIFYTKKNLIIDTSLDNRAGSVLQANEKLTVLNNNRVIDFTNVGDVQANNFSILVDQFTNSGNLVALGTNVRVTSTIDAASINNQNGLIVNNNAGSLELKAAGINNQDGYITSGQLILNATNAINNSQSTATPTSIQGIYANQLSLIANSLNNQQGVISLNKLAQAAYKNVITVNQLDNQSGTIQLVNLNQAPTTWDSFDITARTQLNNQSGYIGLRNLVTNPNPVDPPKDSLLNSQGTNQLIITTAQLNTDTNSQLTSDGHFTLNSQNSNAAKTDLTNAGFLQALNSFVVNANNVNNSGTFASARDLQLNINGFTLTNTNQIFSQNLLSINAANVRNQKDIFAYDNLNINAQGISQIGSLSSGNVLTLNLGSDLVIGANESITAPGALSIITPNTITNNGVIDAHNQLLLKTNTLTNNVNAKIIAGLGFSSTDSNGQPINEHSIFDIANQLNNAGTISVLGWLDINTPTLNNFSTGRILAGGANGVDANNNPEFLNLGGITIDLDPAGDTNTGTLVNDGIIFSHGDVNVLNANSILNQNKAEMFAHETMTLTGSSLVNSQARIEALNGDINLNINTHLVNESSAPPALIEDGKAYGYSLMNSGACKSDGSCAVDDYVAPVCTGSEDCSRYETALANNDPTALSRKQNYDNDNDRASILRGIIFWGKGSLLTYTYQADILPDYQLASIIAGHDVNINNTQTIENNYGTIYAGNDVDINGGNLKLLTKEFLLGQGTVYLSPRPGTCSSANGGGSCSYNWEFSRPSNLDIFNYGFIRAGNNITGDLSGQVTNLSGNKTDSDPQTSETPNNLTPLSDELRDSLGQLLPDDIKKSFLTKTEIDNSTKADEKALEFKSLEDIQAANNAADGAGTGEQSSGFSGETGAEGSSPDAKLTANGDAEVADADADNQTLIAKAQEELLRHNQWPLISFTVLPFNFSLSNLSGLYVLSQNPNSKYLIETRPEFTLYENFLGSDYLLNALGYDVDKTIKRLGDAFFENQLIRDALIKQTNSRYIGDITSNYDMMQLLMNNAVDNASKLELTIGVALTPEQSAALTQDMMWLVKKKVGGEEVLVPQLYLTSVSPEKIAASRAAMGAGGSISLVAKSIENNSSIHAAGNVLLAGTDLLRNQGSIGAGNNLLLTTRGNLEQDGRIFAQGDVRLLAGGAINNNGSVNANNNLIAMAQGDVTNSSLGKMSASQNLLLQSTQGNVINNQGAINGYNITLDANKNVELTGTLAAQNNLSLIAGQDVLLKSTKVETNFVSKKIQSSSVQYTASNLSAGNDILVDAGHNIQAEGSDFTSGGNVSLRADNDVNLLALQNQSNYKYKATRKKIISNTTEHDVANINSGGSVSISAGQDANLIGTNIAANDSVYLSADRDTNISAVVDSDYDYLKTKKNRSFGRSKTKIDETLVETVVGGTIDAGNNVLVNAHVNSEGKLITDASGKVNMLGAVINADGSVVISGDEDVNISGIEYKELDYHQRKKSGLGGFSKSDKGAAIANQLLENASVSAGNDVHLISGNDLNLVAANVIADGNVNMEAINQLLTAAGDVKTKSENWKNSSGLFTSGDVYNKQEHKKGELLVTGQASNIQAGGQVNANVGSGKIIGSNITGRQGIQLIADAGNIDVTTYQTHLESYSKDKEVSVSLGDLVENLTRPDQWIQNTDGRATMTFAKATYDDVDNKTNIVDNQSSTLKSNADISLISRTGEVNIQGSDITADADGINGGVVGLAGATGVNITEANSSYESQTKEVHGTAEMSVVVQHQAVEVVKAIKAVSDAEKQLEQAKRDYKNYERNVDQLEEQLKQLESDLVNKVPGVRVDDVVELRELVSDVKGDKEFYQAGIALAAVNLTTSITGLAQQTAAAAASVGTFGFNAGVQLDVDATKTKTTEKTNTARGSNISGNNIVIQTGTQDDRGQLDTTGTQTTIRGSNLIATQSKSVNADGEVSSDPMKSSIAIQSGDLNILSSKDTSETSNKTEHGHITAQFTVYGSAGGANVNGSYDRNKSTDKSTTINNSQLNADNIELTTSNDLNIIGGNVRANDHLEVDVAGNMNLESQQNRSNSRSVGFGISAGLSGGDGSVNGVNGGFNTSNGMSVSRETVLTSLTSGGTANVKVKGTTFNTGALLATTDENGKDLNQLNFDTGDYVSTDLRNIKQNNQTSIGISANVGIGDSKGNPKEKQNTATDEKGKTLNAQSSNLNYSNTNENFGSKSLATLGHGNISVGGVQLERDGELTDEGKANNSPLIGANRDTENTEKVLWDSSQSQTIDASLDHRLLSEDGRNGIAEDFKRSEILGESIIDLKDESVSLTGKKEGETSLLEHIDTKQKYFSATKNFITDANNEELVKTLNNGNATPEAKQNAYEGLANAIAKEMGISPVEAMILVQEDSNLNTPTYKNTDLNKEITGAAAGKDNSGNKTGKDLLFVVDDKIKTTNEAVNTVGHEMDHLIKNNQDSGLKINDQALYNNNRESYATLMGDATEDYFGFNFSNNNFGTFGTTNLHNGSTTSNSLIAHNNNVFNNLDSGNVDYRQLKYNESEALEQGRKVINARLDLTDEKKAQATYELTVLACGAIKCSEQLPDHDENLADLRWMQTEGEKLIGKGYSINNTLNDLEVETTFKESITGRGGVVYDFTRDMFEYSLGNSVNDFLGNNADGFNFNVSKFSNLVYETAVFALTVQSTGYNSEAFSGYMGEVVVDRWKSENISTVGLQTFASFNPATWQSESNYFLGTVGNVAEVAPLVGSGYKAVKKGYSATSTFFRIENRIDDIPDFNLINTIDTPPAQLGDGLAALKNKEPITDPSRLLEGPDRPTHMQSEFDVQQDLIGFNSQQSYKNGQIAKYGTEGSVRPDLSSSNYYLHIEVKNYDIATTKGRYDMYTVIDKQANSRSVNLPSGSHQGIVIDIRGQNIDPVILNRIPINIESKTNGIIPKNNIVFKTGDGPNDYYIPYN